LKARITLAEPVDPAETLVGTRIVVARFSDGPAFLESYREGEPSGQLAVGTRARLAYDSEIVLEIFWPELPNPLFVRARVVRRLGSKQGLLFALHADSQAARDFLLQMATGERTRWFRRAQRRWCVRLPASWRRFGDFCMRDGTVEDLSSGGALVCTPSEPPRMFDQVGLRIAAPAAGQDLIVTGVVRHAEERSGDFAFGVQFDRGSSGEQRRLRRLVRVFAARGVVIL
jgi:hypothetical protein